MEAPVSASQGAMRSLPMKLESLLSGPKHGLRAEEKKKLCILQGDLQGLIDNYLMEPSEVESPASTANSWMEGVRDLSYDIDDFIYELVHFVGGGARINVVQKPPRFKISRRFPEKPKSRQWITHEISGFRIRVKEAIRQHKECLGNCKWRPISSGQPPPSPSGEAASHLVGVDSSIKQLCGWLANDGQPDHKVASIVGAGGVGKTTLAKQVYRKLGGQFECLAFVRTSPKPDMNGLLTSILSQVRRHQLPDDACDVHNLVLNINTYLQDKTYLIVIEDLWALSTWDLVNRSLPKGKCCSRILTTTEVEIIAQTCCADNSVCIPAKKEDKPKYMPSGKEDNSWYIIKEPLSEDESRELFLNTAFGKQAECPQHLKEVSNEIIKRSGGLPLAIIILASLLARQPASSIEQWNYIKNSLSSTLTTNASLEGIKQVLNLGYDNLPHGLKACMLYLCLYEEDCVIWKDDLVKQWIAEGFIGAVEGDNGEEVARSYFGELVNRGMIQPVDMNRDDEIMSCRVHHMVLQFIRSKSMEENFCIAIDHSHTTIRLSDMVRRLALHLGNMKDAMPPGPESMRLSNVRTVAFSGFRKCMPSIVKFRFLQVLILKLLVDPDNLSYDLAKISELFRLRYFHLDACHVSVVLPTQMQQLKDLVAWEIDAEVTALPSDIVDLPGLLYLNIPSEADLPAGIGRMTSLRTLGVFDLSKNSTETVMSLGQLTNLQELRLTCSTLQPGNLEKNLECLGMIVRKLRNLKRVTLVPAVSSLVNTQDDRDSSSMSISWLGFSIQPLPPVHLQILELSRRCCIFSTLPEWTKELINLCILKIAVRKLSREDVAILKGLPSLAALSLFLWTAWTTPARIMFDDEGFSVLKYFKFVCAAPCLEFLDGAMPNVQKLKLGFNANRLDQYSLGDTGFERLTGLTEISTKIGGTGTADERDRRSAAQSVLTTAVGKHPSNLIINVQWMDWNFSGDEEMDIDSQKEMWKWTSAKQGMTAGESSDEHAVQENNLEEGAKKQAYTRTYMPPESTLHPRNTDIKLSIIEKNTDRIAKKHEVDNDGYGDIGKVAVDVERDEDDGGTVGETFTDYRPPKLSLGLPHPDPVVETSSLSAVQPPEPTYELTIMDELDQTKTLSCLQIESIVYACQRHLHHLPTGDRAGFFVGDGAGVGKGRTIAGLIWENWQQGRHKAVWVSVGSDLKYDARRDLDDVGAKCVQVHPLNKLPYAKLDSKAIGIKNGVIFVTYSSLIASSERGRSRLQQLVQWCGHEFDGLIVFDECHMAKNLIPDAGSQPTLTGKAVLEIQEKLPEARVVYCSATGASEPRNLGYMVRLGLWGDGTSFQDFPQFLGALEKGGVGALELVAMDMKARGMYVCRTLSYKGSDFDTVEAPLEERMMNMYGKAAEFWAELRLELLSAGEISGEEKGISNQIWRLYWASHQRFFRHMCMSAKVPAVVKLAKEALAENKCVVIGLQSTGEARTEEAVTKYGVEMEDFVSGPRELLLKLVEENYPLPPKPDSFQQGEEKVMEIQRKRHSAPDVSFKGRVRKVAKMEGVSDDDSDDYSPSESSDHESTESDEEFHMCQICNSEEETSLLLNCSGCSLRVHPSCLTPPWTGMLTDDWSCYSCKKIEGQEMEHDANVADFSKRYDSAVERKLKILDVIRSLDLPNNPLDDIIDQLGGPDKVAEITGRRGMLIRASDGKGVIYQARNAKEVSMEMINMHEKQQFMNGKKLIAIISEAGSAGVSLHADRRAKNERRRVHVTLELPWSADRAIQQFGRTHRSNQTSAPQYRLLFTNLGGEKRFASIVAKRLESLGALTQGDRRAGPSLSAFNYDSTYGKKALTMVYRGIMEQDSFPVVPPRCSDNEASIQEFITEAKVALVSVGIIRDATVCNGKVAGKLSGRIVDSDMHDVARFLNRLLGLAPDIQNRLFDLFTSILDVVLHNARREGQLDSGIVDIKAKNIEMKEPPKTVHIDSLSGATTVLFTFTIDRGVTWESAKAMLDGRENDAAGSSNDGFYESKREWMGRRHFTLALAGSSEGIYKIIRPAIGEALREMPLSELKGKYRKVSSIDKVSKGWQDEYDVSSKQCMHGSKCKVGSYCTVGRRLQEFNILGGLILPVWGTIEKALAKQVYQNHKRVRVVRLETTNDNQRIVGLFIPNAAVESVLTGLQWVQDIND